MQMTFRLVLLGQEMKPEDNATIAKEICRLFPPTPHSPTVKDSIKIDNNVKRSIICKTFLLPLSYIERDQLLRTWILCCLLDGNNIFSLIYSFKLIRDKIPLVYRMAINFLREDQVAIRTKVII